MKPCIRCLSLKYVRKRSGPFCIIQCEECGQNSTAQNFEDAERSWNDYKVWGMVDALIMAVEAEENTTAN
jgi:hypothetical protein